MQPYYNRPIANINVGDEVVLDGIHAVLGTVIDKTEDVAHVRITVRVLNADGTVAQRWVATFDHGGSIGVLMPTLGKDADIDYDYL